MHEELFAELEGSGHKVSPGQLGENITTRGLDILNLPQGTRLAFGDGGAVVQVGFTLSRRKPRSSRRELSQGIGLSLSFGNSEALYRRRAFKLKPEAVSLA
jgi:hypothetical protein